MLLKTPRSSVFLTQNLLNRLQTTNLNYSINFSYQNLIIHIFHIVVTVFYVIFKYNVSDCVALGSCATAPKYFFDFALVVIFDLIF